MNAETKCEYQRKYYAANSEKYRDRARKYYAADPEKYRADRRKYYAANAEKRRAARREWVTANREKVCKANRKYWGHPTPTRPMPELCERDCGRKAAHLDHCHITGAFRGWLCRRCNLGIGLLGDTAEDLRAGLKYLER